MALPIFGCSGCFAVRVLGSVLQIVGLIVTTWRICFRLRIHLFWWEDAWAAIAMLSCVASLIGEWTNLLGDKSSALIAYWFYTLGFYSVVSAAHLSILFSIIRIIPESRLRTFTYLLAACFCIFWIIITVVRAWWCTFHAHWNLVLPACSVAPQLALFSFAWDLFEVIPLILIPLCILWKIKLPRSQRRMILCIFASSVVLAFAAIFHAVGYLIGIPVLRIAGMDFEIACSIIMCNLLVVVPYVYRIFWRDAEDSETTTSNTGWDDFSTRTTRQPMSLTTVWSGLTEQLTAEPVSTQSHSFFTDSSHT